MKVIYVDDEKPAIDNFRFTIKNFSQISTLKTFQNGLEALNYVKNNVVDVAFLDMEMPGIHGIDLAMEIKKADSRSRIVFVTAFSQYALDAWGVDATGYLLKPYTAADVQKELSKCTYMPMPSHRVVIETMPTFNITVDGNIVNITGSKTKEMLALLTDRAKQGVTMGECIACLWPYRGTDSKTQSLYRMTYKRLADALENAGVGNIIETSDKHRFLRVELVDCDLYNFLDGEESAREKYCGEYLSEYSWAEDTNARLYWIANK